MFGIRLLGCPDNGPAAPGLPPANRAALKKEDPLQWGAEEGRNPKGNKEVIKRSGVRSFFT